MKKRNAKRGRKENTNIYAYYKGDNLISVGTVSEIANEQGVARESLYYYKTPSYIARTQGGNARRLIMLEEGEEEEEGEGVMHALYQGDKLVSMGTIQEIASELGIKDSTVIFYKSKAYARRTSNQAIRVIEID